MIQPSHPQSGPPQPPKKKNHTGELIAGLVILGLIVFVSCVAGLAGLGSAPEASPPPDVATSDEPATESEPKKTLPTSAPTKTTSTSAYVVEEVIDGDTVDLDTGKRVRLIGIDAPESDECGASAATKAMRGLVLNKRVVLHKGAATDKDRYGRLLRYVDVKGTDAGLALLKRGLAVPRYDSTDGYGEHPREDRYYRLAESPDTCPAPKPKPKPLAQPRRAPDEPWNRPGPDLDCADIGHPVDIDGPDYHRLDRDGDGVGCEAS